MGTVTDISANEPYPLDPELRETIVNSEPRGVDAPGYPRGQYRPGRGRQFRPDYAGRARAAEALRLSASGKTWPEITEIMGYKGKNSAERAVRMLMRRTEDHLAHEFREMQAERRAIELAKLDHQYQQLQATIDDPPYVYDVKGELVLGPDGEAMRDRDAVTRAALAQTKTSERVSRLLGLDITLAQQKAAEDAERKDYAALIAEMFAKAAELSREYARPAGELPAAVPDVVDAIVIDAIVIEEEPAELDLEE